MDAKTYSTAANARRAARTAGLQDGEYMVEPTGDGRYNFVAVNTTPDTEPVEVEPQEDTPVPAPAPRNRSEVAKPVAVVWGIVAEHPNATRKAQVGMAVAAGVNFYTARTQVQLARKAQKDAAAAPEPEVSPSGDTGITGEMVEVTGSHGPEIGYRQPDGSILGADGTILVEAVVEELVG